MTNVLVKMLISEQKLEIFFKNEKIGFCVYNSIKFGYEKIYQPLW